MGIHKESEVAPSCPTLCDAVDCSPHRLLRPWDSPGRNPGVGCQFLLQGIFPTQGWNPGLRIAGRPSELPGKLMGVTFPLIFPHPSGMTWYVAFSVRLVSLECGHQYVHRDLRICPWTLLCNPLRFWDVYWPLLLKHSWLATLLAAVTDTDIFFQILSHCRLSHDIEYTVPLPNWKFFLLMYFTQSSLYLLIPAS